MINSKNNAKRRYLITLKRIKSLLHSKPGIATLFTLIGIGLATLVSGVFLNNAKEKEKAHYYPDSFFESDLRFDHDPFFFTKTDIFDEMNRAHQRMDRAFDHAFESHRRYMNQVFLDTHRRYQEMQKSANNKARLMERKRWSKMAVRQNDTSYRYELSFSGFDKDRIAVSITNNILTLAATQNEQSNKTHYQVHSDANFHYSFSVPQYKGEPTIIRENNKITVIFSK